MYTCFNAKMTKNNQKFNMLKATKNYKSQKHQNFKILKKLLKIKKITKNKKLNTLKTTKNKKITKNQNFNAIKNR